MRIGYVDAFSGVAGDMWVGALLDLGLPLADLADRIATLRLPGVRLRADRVRRGALSAVHFVVEDGSTLALPDATLPAKPPRRAPAAHEHRGLREIEALLAGADLPERTRAGCQAVFRRLAEAEAKVHGTTVDEVHFHEVGAVDTIVDIVCAVLGTELLGIERYYASPVAVGTGTVRCEHGTLPVPAPATLELLTGVPIRAGELEGERATPTGAALLKVLVAEFARPVAFVPERVGYGAGTRDDPRLPNCLRITLGEARAPGAATALLEVACNLDTASGEQLAFLLEGCLGAGAVDAFALPATMKKGRPAFVLHALCDEGARERVVRFLLEESGSLGVRVVAVERYVLERWSETRATPLGPVRMKCARLPSGALVARPEDDEVARLVRERGLLRHEVLARLGAAPGR